VTGDFFALPAAHTVLGTIGNAVEQFSNALEATRHGQWGNALDAAHKAVNPVSSALFGGKLREQAANPQAHPELESTVQTSMKGGNKFDLKTVLNQSAFEKAKTAWSEGNKIGAGVRFADGVYHVIEAPVFDHYIPNLKASAKGMAAKIAMDRDLSGKALSEHMARAQDDVDNILGMVKRSHQLQDKIVTDVLDVLFDAPKFAEGTFRFAGAFGRDTIRGLADIAQGKAPTITRAHYTAMAGLMTHMIGAAVTQMVWTKLHTGTMIPPTTVEDYFKPRTGDKDDKGRDERVSILSPFSALFGAVEHGAGSVTGRVAHLWKTGAAEISGHDERGRSIEGERLKFLGKSLTPLPVQSLAGMNDEGHTSPPRERLAGALGMHFSHDYASSAANAAQRAINDRRGNGEFGRAETDKMDAEGRLRQELHEQNPDAQRDIQAAIEAGKITAGDARSMRKSRPEGLPGLLKSSSLDARTIMEKVWPKMTPQERRDNQWLVRGKIGRGNLSDTDKQKYWSQIQTETANVK
jgi:hypothetical protein